jgi:hypothetical protein
MRTRRWAANVGVAIASAGLALLFTECALGIIRPQDRSVWMYTRHGLVVHPAGIEVYLPKFGQWVRTNEWGMRDRPHALAKPAGTFRILVLGDSFMEALQVAFDESLPSRLEASLAERGGPVEVINGSTSGWGTDDEVTYLERYGIQFEPDLVLVALTVHNDVSDNLVFEHHELRDGRIVPRPPVETAALDWALVRGRDWVAGQSHLYNVYRRLKAIRQGQAEADDLDAHVASLIRRESDERTNTGWEVTRKLLDRMRDVAHAGDAQTAVFVIPLAIQLADAPLERFLADRGISADAIELDRPQRVVAEWGARTGVAVIDLLADFRAATQSGDELYIPLDGHWNRDGHALAAEVVARELVARGLVVVGNRQARR